ITGAPLTPTVFRTFRGLQVVKSNEFLEPLRANWQAAALGVTLFGALALWIARSLLAGALGPAPSFGSASVLLTGGLFAACLAGLATWATPPVPVEVAFAREYLGLDGTVLDVPETKAIADLRDLVGLPAGAAWVGDDYPLAYV